MFSEYHLEKVFAPCFMVRLGHFKYILVHEHDEQLFDLDADPGEPDRPERDAMRHNGTHWDYEPRFDPTTQFVR